MSGWFKRTAWHLLGILSSLEAPPEKGREWKPYFDPNGTTRLETAIQYLKIFAKHFRESFVWLRMAVIFLGYSARNSSISLCLRVRLLFSEVRQSQGHILRSSCPPENTQNEVLSNAKKVDAPITSCDDGEQWQKTSKPRSSPLHFAGGGGQP
jgi:hypothetical protein